MSKDKNIKKITLIIFTLAYATLAVVFILSKQMAYLAESIAIYSGYLLYVYLEKKEKIFIKWYIVILALINAIIHSYLGHFVGLYDVSKYFDKLLHVYGIFSFSLVAYSIIIGSFGIKLNSSLWVFIVVSLSGITIGTLFEIAEFILDITLKTQSQKGLLDTNLDLICDVVGALLAGLTATNSRLAYSMRNKSSHQ